MEEVMDNILSLPTTERKEKKISYLSQASLRIIKNMATQGIPSTGVCMCVCVHLLNVVIAAYS